MAWTEIRCKQLPETIARKSLQNIKLGFVRVGIQNFASLFVIPPVFSSIIVWHPVGFAEQIKLVKTPSRLSMSDLWSACCHGDQPYMYVCTRPTLVGAHHKKLRAIPAVKTLNSFNHHQNPWPNAKRPLAAKNPSVKRIAEHWQKYLAVYPCFKASECVNRRVDLALRDRRYVIMFATRGSNVRISANRGHAQWPSNSFSVLKNFSRPSWVLYERVGEGVFWAVARQLDAHSDKYGVVENMFFALKFDIEVASNFEATRVGWFCLGIAFSTSMKVPNPRNTGHKSANK